MNIELAEEEAWSSLDQGEPERALKIWNELIARSQDEVRDILESHSCYALIALKRIDEARAIYLKLFNKCKNHRYAHQLCMVEREDGNFEKALQWLVLEEELIEADDILSLAAHTYEMSKINELMGELQKAETYAKECLVMSLETSDLIMHACAKRLMGDIYRHSNKEEALRFYTQAKKIFIEADDTVGADEIDVLIKKINP